MRKSRRLPSGIARGYVVAATAVLLAACGAGKNAPPGTGQAASGEPIVIGLINQEGTGLGPESDVREASEAAVKYINAELNGLGGRPIKLETCITNGSPESSARCANKMVERKVVAVRGGIDFGSAASLPILKAAGIPDFFGIPLLPADFTTDGAFTFGAGGLDAAGAVYVADELKAKRVSILYADAGAGRNLAENFVKQPLINQGIRAADIKMVPEKNDAADFSPALAAANQGDPDAIIVVFPPPMCSRIMQARAALGVKAPMFYIGPCGDPSAVKAGGAGADGMYFNSPLLNVEANKNDPDVRTYLEKMGQYASSLDPASFFAAAGFAATMMVYKRLAPLDPSTLSPATVSAIFKSATNAPGFMTHDYTCDGKQASPEFVSVCDTNVRLYQFKGGHYRDVLGDWVSAGAALRP